MTRAYALDRLICPIIRFPKEIFDWMFSSKGNAFKAYLGRKIYIDFPLAQYGELQLDFADESHRLLGQANIILIRPLNAGQTRF